MSLFSNLIVQYIAEEFDVFELDKYLIAKSRLSDIVNKQFLLNREFFSDWSMLSLTEIEMSFISITFYAKLNNLMGVNLDLDIFEAIDTNEYLPFNNYNQFRDYVKHTQ
jgi:hypothetical protein